MHTPIPSDINPTTELGAALLLAIREVVHADNRYATNIGAGTDESPCNVQLQDVLCYRACRSVDQLAWLVANNVTESMTCDECGIRFPMNAVDCGATHTMTSPDSENVPETWETYCPKCAQDNAEQPSSTRPEDWLAANLRMEASEVARVAATPCKTVADLLACDNPDVRLAAQMALGTTLPTLPK